MIFCRSCEGIPPCEASVGTNSETMRKDSSEKDSSAQSFCQPDGRVGICSGMYRPPFGARPRRTAWHERIGQYKLARQFNPPAPAHLFERQPLWTAACAEVLHGSLNA